jgi:hypothetical protein
MAREELRPHVARPNGASAPGNRIHPAARAGVTGPLPPLTRAQYAQWAAVLQARYGRAVDGYVPFGAYAESDDEIAVDARALGEMSASLTPELARTFGNITNATDLWKCLATYHDAAHDIFRVMELQHKLAALISNPGRNPKEFVNLLMPIEQDLKNAGVQRSDNERKMDLLSAGLTFNNDAIRTLLTACPPEHLSLDQVLRLVANLSPTTTSPPHSNAHYNSRGQTRSRSRAGAGRGGRGGHSKTTDESASDMSNSESSDEETSGAYHSAHIVHAPNDRHLKANSVKHLRSGLSTRGQCPNWEFDSGASTSMTPYKSDLKDMRPIYDITVVAASGTLLKARGIGTAIIKTGNNMSVSISDVLYVPGLSVKLISEGALLSSGNTILKEGDCMVVLDKERNVAMRGCPSKQSPNVFEVDTSDSAYAAPINATAGANAPLASMCQKPQMRSAHKIMRNLTVALYPKSKTENHNKTRAHKKNVQSEGSHDGQPGAKTHEYIGVEPEQSERTYTLYEPQIKAVTQLDHVTFNKAGQKLFANAHHIDEKRSSQPTTNTGMYTIEVTRDTLASDSQTRKELTSTTQSPNDTARTNPLLQNISQESLKPRTNDRVTERAKTPQLLAQQELLNQRTKSVRDANAILCTTDATDIPNPGSNNSRKEALVDAWFDVKCQRDPETVRAHDYQTSNCNRIAASGKHPSTWSPKHNNGVARATTATQEPAMAYAHGATRCTGTTHKGSVIERILKVPIEPDSTMLLTDLETGCTGNNGTTVPLQMVGTCDGTDGGDTRVELPTIDTNVAGTSAQPLSKGRHRTHLPTLGTSTSIWQGGVC